MKNAVIKFSLASILLLTNMFVSPIAHAKCSGINIPENELLKVDTQGELTFVGLHGQINNADGTALKIFMNVYNSSDEQAYTLQRIRFQGSTNRGLKNESGDEATLTLDECSQSVLDPSSHYIQIEEREPPMKVGEVIPMVLVFDPLLITPILVKIVDVDKAQKLQTLLAK